MANLILLLEHQGVHALACMFHERGVRPRPCGAHAGVANLAHRDGIGLQKAMLLVPVCFMLSGIGFYFAEKLLAEDKRTNQLPPGSPASMQ